MLNEFKKFAMRGNVIDLAVGVVIGGAFGKIVASLVGDIIMPLLALLIGGVEFSNLVYRDINYGLFIQAVFDFLIISFSIFMFIKFISRFKKKEEAVAEAPVKVDRQEELLTEIRDLLKANNTTKNNETS
ncbi:large-conductance mechanosensitive channel protein MscL [Neobacillus sp. FSL H8-0543]|uniref:large-conductance mechanosensitive channel protein MscL n=1 Tax=Neobacillus sp. FSL H8-0543 TaxID=2954672 RepID=UPI00315956CA